MRVVSGSKSNLSSGDTSSMVLLPQFHRMCKEKASQDNELILSTAGTQCVPLLFY